MAQKLGTTRYTIDLDPQLVEDFDKIADRNQRTRAGELRFIMLRHIAQDVDEELLGRVKET